MAVRLDVVILSEEETVQPEEARLLLGAAGKAGVGDAEDRQPKEGVGDSHTRRALLGLSEAGRQAVYMRCAALGLDMCSASRVSRTVGCWECARTGRAGGLTTTIMTAHEKIQRHTRRKIHGHVHTHMHTYIITYSSMIYHPNTHLTPPLSLGPVEERTARLGSRAWCSSASGCF
jgi:hypothetical protein